MLRRTGLTKSAALTATLALGLVACGSDSEEEATPAATPEDTEASAEETGDEPAASGSEEEGGTSGGSAAADVDLSGVSLTVGSKEFTEQLLVGQMAVLALEEAGADVSDETGLNGTQIVREALLGGEVDLYWDYSGTGWITFLGNDEPIPDEDEQFQATKESDLEENDVQWFAMAPLNNTYALAVKEGDGPDVSTLSDVGPYLEENSDDSTLCVETEFNSRDDGLAAVVDTYGYEFDAVEELALGVIYTQIGSDTCAFGEVFTTDGRIVAQNLRVLEDDMGAFPNYNLGMTMLTPVYEENSEAYEELFGAIAETLENDVVQELNRRVDVDGEAPEDVARDHLVETGIIAG